MVEAKSGMKEKDRLPPIHPGEILREEFPSPPGMPSHQLAMALRVPATRVSEIRYNLAIADGFAQPETGWRSGFRHWRIAEPPQAPAEEERAPE